MKATEQYFHVVLLIILYKVVLTFKSVGETAGYCVAIHAVQLVCSCSAKTIFVTSFSVLNSASL